MPFPELQTNKRLEEKKALENHFGMYCSMTLVVVVVVF